jgi:hypothetical protein
MFAAFGDSEKKLLVQASRIVTSQLFPYLDWQGKVRLEIKAKYEVLNSKLAMELGEKELGPAGIWYASGQLSNWYSYTPLQIAENFMTAPFAGGNADSFVKDRLSYVELAFRDREYEVLHYVASIDQRILEAKRAPVGKKLLIPGDPADGIRTVTKSVSDTFAVNVDELNQRLRRAGANLHYHNGFIQPSGDELLSKRLEEPFWKLVSGPLWKNVDHDMKEAVEGRDRVGRDPNLFAMKALESCIKIIASEKDLVTGNETGATNFIERLAGKNIRFIDPWEADLLKQLFKETRNPFGHGPGASPMPKFTASQVNWSIDTAMAWIRSLIERFDKGGQGCT